MKNFFSKMMVIGLILFPFLLIAQTTHTVEVGPGMTYSPSELTIQEGDVVTWISLGGTHDVNFDLNSVTGESFGNPAEIALASLPVLGTGEMGSITFNNYGTYSYDCSVGSHAANGMTGTITVTPSAGFYPPVGSSFNEDSTAVTLPNAAQNVDYNESITFYATEEITMTVGGSDVALGFVSAEILSVSAPEGMTATCVPSDCVFGPNAWGEVNLSGTALEYGVYELDLSAMVTVNLANLGIDSDLTFPIPYNGENPILNMAIGGTDYSAINSFVPTFLLNVDPDAGFYPPLGSSFNEDSSVVTLPDASDIQAYNESITFYATDEITMNVGGSDISLGFVSAEILSVSAPEGMTSTCVPSDCVFGPNAWGEVNLSGTATTAGSYQLDLNAMVTVNLANLGIDSDLTFPIPYNGENPILNMAIGGTDYSAINSFVPTFILNVTGEVVNVIGCTDSNANNYNPDATEDDGSCEYEELTGVRYVDEVFDNVVVSSNVMYGSNIGIITQAPALEDLHMDIYEPAGDTETNRPVVIMLHTGSFLPAIVNGQATGDKSDNSIVEMCTRFAKKGYVAIAVNYRLGWNPVSPSEDVRRSTLIQAAYRGLQDTKTAVRYLRKSAAEDGNPYGVGDQFAVGGHGTGGYLSLAMATLNDYESELLLPKFIDTSEETIATYGQPMPYIIPSIMGNFEGTDYGMMPYDSDGDGIPDMEIPLSIPNHVGYSSEVNMVFNAGGALPDISWLEAGEVPIASMQNIADPDAPYAEGNVIVPTTGEFVIVAHGSQLVQENATAYGNNDVFAGLTTSVTDAWYNNGDAAANAAVAGHDDLPGLFGMITPAPSASPTACGFQTVQNAPWDWWDNAMYGAMADGYHGMPAGTMGCVALLGNPDMSAEKGAAMCDMMDEFFTPRVAAALNLVVTPERYVDEIFDEVAVSSNVVYGSNIGIITQAPALEDLHMDVYEPVGDEATDRRVVILLHTGSFLPAIVNGQATGDKSDNSIVEMCTRFAKKGYVAVAVNYRLGWNPVSPSEDVRRSTLIQAAYRGLQDTKTAVRFLRKSAAEDGNPYGVGEQFAVGGHGTGGYLSLAMATLNDYESELLLPKFIDTSEETIATYGQPMPYIIPSIMGNFEGTDYGMMPYDSDGDGIPDMEIPLSIPNHVGYSSEVNMVFNAGGALPDISWLEAGEVPIASMQNIADPDAPYAEGNVIVPTTGEFVIVAHGSQLVQENATAFGNNDVFNGLTTSVTDAWYSNGDAAANAAVAGHADLPGLFGMITPDPSASPTACGFETVQNGPWDWWDNAMYGAMADGYHGMPAGTMGCVALLGNPDMSAEKGAAMCDMMDEFFTPRMHAALSSEGDDTPEGPSDQLLNLPNGWSMFSTYMMADNMAMDVVLEPIVAQVIIAKNYLGAAYLPEWGFNGIGDIIIGQGYQIKTSESVDLSISGDYMTPEDNSIELVAGWNMIGYLRLEAAAADLALADLVDAGNLIIAKDYLGAAFLPEWGFNGIGDLMPGSGYQIKTNTAGTLTYLSNDESYRLAAMEVTLNDVKHFTTPLNTGSNMHIGISDEAWVTTPQIGDEVSAYNSKGELVGSAIFSSPITVITVWGDDATTSNVDGLMQHEALIFKLWSKRYNSSQEMTVKEWIEGTNAYQTDALYQIGAIEPTDNSSNVSHFGLYPIPAKQELNLDIDLSASETISISIYNLIGELVSTQTNDLVKGLNTIQLNIASLNEGAYLCKVNSNDRVIARKFNVIK